MSNKIFTNTYLMKMLRNQESWLVRDMYPTQTNYFKKGTGSFPNQTSGWLWTKLDLKWGPSPKKGPRLPISLVPALLLSWYVGFILSNLKSTSSPTAGNISPRILCWHPSKLRWKGSLNLLPCLVQPNHLLNLGPIQYPGVGCFAIGPDWVTCLHLNKGQRFMIGLKEEK